MSAVRAKFRIPTLGYAVAGIIVESHDSVTEVIVGAGCPMVGKELDTARLSLPHRI